jgi:hypothetical protein
MKFSNKLIKIVWSAVAINILCYVLNLFFILKCEIIVSSGSEKYSTLIRCEMFMALMLFMLSFWFILQIRYNKKLLAKSTYILISDVTIVIVMQNFILDLFLCVLNITQNNKFTLNGNVYNNVLTSTTFILIAVVSMFLTMIICTKLFDITFIVNKKTKGH